MQNKANLLNTQMNVKAVKTKYYENKRLCRRGKNKPNQTQFIVSLSNLPVVSLPALSKVVVSNHLGFLASAIPYGSVSDFEK
jgi:hypothetical protein